MYETPLNETPTHKTPLYKGALRSRVSSKLRAPSRSRGLGPALLALGLQQQAPVRDAVLRGVRLRGSDLSRTSLCDLTNLLYSV